MDCDFWINEYEKEVWNKLSNKQKYDLCRRFGLKYTPFATAKDLINQIEIPILPLSFTIASLNQANIINNYLLNTNEYTELWHEKITYDQDKWGTKRLHKNLIGIFSNSNQIKSKKTQLYFEMFLKSYPLLDKNEKVRLILATPSLSKSQIENLIILFEDENKKFFLAFKEDTNEVLKLIHKTEDIWKELIENIDYYNNLDSNFIDNTYHLTPSFIQYHIEKSVKGQSHAVKIIATLLYYHQKIYKAYERQEPLPFQRMEPFLIVGATGTGKSYILQTGCDIMGIPFLHVDASSLVQSGIVGQTLDDVMKNLIRKTNYHVGKAEVAIVLFDEIDKLLSSHHGKSVLYELLRIIEGAEIPIDPYNAKDRMKEIDKISTNNMLFLFAGSFQHILDEKVEYKNQILNVRDIENTKLPKEFLGRINQVIVLNKLTKAELKEILLNSKKSPLNEIKKMLEVNNIKVEITNDTIEKILKKSEKSPYGARALKKIAWEYFQEILYDAPVYNKLSKEKVYKI